MVKKDILDEAGKSRSSKGKNEMMRECLDVIITNQIKFKWVITDLWFGSAENMNAIMGHGREFIMPLKNNRKVALSKEDKARGKYVPIGSLGLQPGTCLEVYMEKTPFPVTLIKEEYVNKDYSTGILYLVCSDLTATYQQIIILYQKRWKVEEYHKSLKTILH
jgi:hypothetical protein